LSVLHIAAAKIDTARVREEKAGQFLSTAVRRAGRFYESREGEKRGESRLKGRFLSSRLFRGKTLYLCFGPDRKGGNVAARTKSFPHKERRRGKKGG